MQVDWLADLTQVNLSLVTSPNKMRIQYYYSIDFVQALQNVDRNLEVHYVFPPLISCTNGSCMVIPYLDIPMPCTDTAGYCSHLDHVFPHTPTMFPYV